MEQTNEGQKTEGNPKTQTSQNASDGIQYEAPRAVRQANEAAQRIEQGISKMDEKLAELNEAYARNALGGQSFGGSAPAQKQVLSPKEYAKIIMSGKIPPKE